MNIIEQPETGSLDGAHAPIGGGTEFKEGLESASWIDLPELDTARVAETMFHEVSHLKEWELAQEWIKKYKTETQSLFVKSAPNPSQVWLTAQIKKNRLTVADAEMIFIVIGDASAYT